MSIGIADIWVAEGSGAPPPPPIVTGAFAVDSTTVRVTFDQEMKHVAPGNSDDALNPANYGFTVVGGVSRSASSVSLHLANPTQVDVSLDGEMTGGASYTVKVSNAESAAGIVINPAADSKTFVGVGVQPRVLSATGNADYIRVVFDSDMSDTGLTTPGNYTFAGPTVLITDHVIKQNSTTVDVYPAEEQQQGGAYTITVANVTDLSDNVIDPAHDDAGFTGTGVAPKLLAAASQGSTTVRLTFNEEVDTATSQVPGNYVIVGGSGLAVTGASKIDAVHVDLTTDEQTTNQSYQVTVSNVEDLAGNPIQPPYNVASFLGIGKTYPLITITPSDGSTNVALDKWFRINVHDLEEFFSGIDQSSWQISIEYLDGTTLVHMDVMVDGVITPYFEGTISGDASGYTGINAEFRPHGTPNWRPTTAYTVSCSVKDVDGYQATKTATITTGEGEDVCNQDYIWKLIPEDVRFADAQKADNALFKFTEVLRFVFEKICSKITAFSDIRDPWIIRTSYDENVDVDITAVTVGTDRVTLSIDETSDLSEVSANWILDDGNVQFKVLAVRKLIAGPTPADPNFQDPEIDIEGVIAPDISGTKILRPQSMIAFLAQDFGLEIDKNEPEGFQRSSISNVVQWLGLKGSEEAYRIRGLISGFDVSVIPLWAIPKSMTETLPTGTWWKIDDRFYTMMQPRLPRFDEIQGDSGLLDTFCWESPTLFSTSKKVTGVVSVSGGYRVDFDASVLDLKPMQVVGNWKLVDSKSGSEVLATGDGIKTEFHVSAAKPVIAPGTFAIQYTSGSVSKTITDDGLGLLVGDVNGGRKNTIDYESGALDFECSDVPDNATDIEATYHREFWIESFDDSGATSWVKVGPYTYPPEKGTSDIFYLRYACQDAEVCWFCKTAKLRVAIEAGSILDDPSADVSEALIKMVRKLADVTPAHVKLAQVVFLTRINANVPYSVGLDLSPLVHVWAPMRDQFDGITGDE